MMSAALLWILFGLFEQQANAQGWNIRVDLLLSWPVLFIVSVASAWIGFRSIMAGEVGTPDGRHDGK